MTNSLRHSGLTPLATHGVRTGSPIACRQTFHDECAVFPEPHPSWSDVRYTTILNTATRASHRGATLPRRGSRPSADPTFARRARRCASRRPAVKVAVSSRRPTRRVCTDIEGRVTWRRSAARMTCPASAAAATYSRSRGDRPEKLTCWMASPGPGPVSQPSARLPEHGVTQDGHAVVAVVEAGNEGEFRAARLTEERGVLPTDFVDGLDAVGGETR